MGGYLSTCMNADIANQDTKQSKDPNELLTDKKEPQETATELEETHNPKQSRLSKSGKSSPKSKSGGSKSGSKSGDIKIQITKPDSPSRSIKNSHLMTIDDDNELVVKSRSNVDELKGILDDHLGMRYFTKFSKANKSIEYFRSYLDILEYKAIPTDDYRKIMARKLYGKYIKNKAVSAIGGISVETRNELQRRIYDRPPDISSNMFDEIEEQIFHSLSFDVYPQFKKSDLFKRYCGKQHERMRRVRVTDFDYMEKLGSGAFGSVVRVKKKSTGIEYAMKILDKAQMVQDKKHNKNNIRMERDIFLALHHPFTVNLKYAFHTQDHAYLVLDLVRGGTFQERLGEAMPEAHAKFYAAELLLALKHLHELKIIHRDLKADNVLMDEDGHVRLADMGCAIKMTKHRKRDSVLGAPGYKAPEMLKKSGYGFSVDWWSYGLFVLCLLTGKNPFHDDKDKVDPDKAVLQVEIHKLIPDFITDDAKDFLLQLLEHDVSNRLGCTPNMGSDAEAIQEHKWFGDIDWDKLLNKEITAPAKPELPEADERKRYSSIMEVLDEFKSDDKLAEAVGFLGENYHMTKEDHQLFKGFSHISPSAFKDELLAPQTILTPDIIAASTQRGVKIKPEEQLIREKFKERLQDINDASISNNGDFERKDTGSPKADTWSPKADTGSPKPDTEQSKSQTNSMSFLFQKDSSKSPEKSISVTKNNETESTVESGIEDSSKHVENKVETQVKTDVENHAKHEAESDPDNISENRAENVVGDHTGDEVERDAENMAENGAENMAEKDSQSMAENDAEKDSQKDADDICAGTEQFDTDEPKIGTDSESLKDHSDVLKGGGEYLEKDKELVVDNVSHLDDGLSSRVATEGNGMKGTNCESKSDAAHKDDVESFESGGENDKDGAQSTSVSASGDADVSMVLNCDSASDSNLVSEKQTSDNENSCDSSGDMGRKHSGPIDSLKS